MLPMRGIGAADDNPSVNEATRSMMIRRSGDPLIPDIGGGAVLCVDINRPWTKTNGP